MISEKTDLLNAFKPSLEHINNASILSDLFVVYFQHTNIAANHISHRLWPEVPWMVAFPVG